MSDPNRDLIARARAASLLFQTPRSEGDRQRLGRAVAQAVGLQDQQTPQERPRRRLVALEVVRHG